MGRISFIIHKNIGSKLESVDGYNFYIFRGNLFARISKKNSSNSSKASRVFDIDKNKAFLHFKHECDPAIYVSLKPV